MKEQPGSVLNLNNKYTPIDDLIKQALHKQVEINKNIDMDDAWEKYQQKYGRKKRVRKPALMLACLLLLFTFTMFLPSESRAINLKIFDSIKSFVSGKVQTAFISFDTQKEKDTENYISPEVYSILKDIPYEVLLPLEMMDTYRLENAEITPIGNTRQVELFFNDSEVSIIQIKIVGGLHQGISYDIEDAIMKKANVKGQEATLIVYKNGFSKLSWIDRDIFVTIVGTLSEDDILLLANSIRRINLQQKS